jgi:nucleoside-diphosphate-sugar epimerase
MKIGITGATGTLGRRLTGKLIDGNNRVIALCRNKDSAKARLGPSVDIVEGDITRMDSLQPFVNDIDVCIHLAAQVDHADKNRYLDVNVNGTKNLCDAIMESNPKCRFVYCSSIVVLRLNEMKTNYSTSKAKGEEVVRSMMIKGLSATIIYSGLIFGPGDERFIPHLQKGLKTGNIPLVGGGESWTPLIYIDDLCELFIKAAESEYAIGKSFLGIQQTSAGMHDFIKIIAQQCGYPVPDKRISKSRLLFIALAMEWLYSIPFINRRPPINKRIVDILTINYRPPSFENEMRLGWRPETSMEVGIKAFLNKTELNN